MFIVPLHCCQNLALPNVPTRRLLPGNPTTAASATVWGLNGHRQWLVGARNWITVIIERSDHSLATYWGLNFCWWLFTTFYTSFQKNVKSHVFWNLKKRKIRILEHWEILYHTVSKEATQPAWSPQCPTTFQPRGHGTQHCNYKYSTEYGTIVIQFLYNQSGPKFPRNCISQSVPCHGIVNSYLQYSDNDLSHRAQ